jgi:spoIIIJ-associated protein
MAHHDDERSALPPPEKAPEKVAAAKAFIEELFRRLGAAVEVATKETAEAIGVSVTAKADNKVEVSGILVEAVQYLTNRVVNHGDGARKWVNVDVGGFSDESDPAVVAMAERLAAAATRMNKVLAVVAINARERRQIHLALVGHAAVQTRSDGEGLFRRLLIIPKALSPVPSPAPRG